MGLFEAFNSALNNTLSPLRSEPTKQLDKTTILGGEYEEFTLHNLDGYSAIILSIKAAYNQSATAGIRVRWMYSPDGINFDSVLGAENQGNYKDIAFTAGTTEQETVLIPIFTPYVKIQLVNLDSTYSVVVDVWSLLMR